MRPQLVLAVVGLFSGACSPFGENARESSPATDGGPAGAVSDAATASPDAAAPLADAGCDSGCVLFEDDFERAANDLLGQWTRKVGDPGMGNAGPERGMVLLATGGAGSAQTFREELLEKTFEPRRDLTLRLQLRRQPRPDAGTFGEDLGADYCQLVTLLLGSHRVAMFHAYGDGLGWWLYRPDELAGEGDDFAAPGSEWTSLEMVMEWTETNVRVKTTFGSETKAERTLGVGSFADAPPKVQVGYRCTGTTPPVEVAYDAVVVRSNR